MNLPTVILALIVFGVFSLIVGKGIQNKKNHKSGCGCNCGNCGGCNMCHPSDK